MQKRDDDKDKSRRTMAIPRPITHSLRVRGCHWTCGGSCRSHLTEGALAAASLACLLLGRTCMEFVLLRHGQQVNPINPYQQVAIQSLLILPVITV